VTGVDFDPVTQSVIVADVGNNKGTSMMTQLEAATLVYGIPVVGSV
jgi:hypothetical protein